MAYAKTASISATAIGLLWGHRRLPLPCCCSMHACNLCGAVCLKGRARGVWGVWAQSERPRASALKSWPCPSHFSAVWACSKSRTAFPRFRPASPAPPKRPDPIPTRTKISDSLGVFHAASGFSTKRLCKDVEEGSHKDKAHTQYTGTLSSYWAVGSAAWQMARQPDT